MARKKKKLGEILINWNLLGDNDLADALQYANEQGKRIGESLIELELCSEDNVTKALATQFDMEYVDLDKNVVSRGALQFIPEKLIRDYSVIPLSAEDGKLRVIVSDPLDLSTLDLLHFRLNTQIEPCLAPINKIKAFIQRNLDKMDSEISETMQSIDQDAAPEDLVEGDPKFKGDDDDHAPIIRLINLMIAEAVRTRASDIHIEPMADRVRVRYRIDGVCIKRDNVPLNMKSAVTTRLKIMSGMDIAERRVPQDGRIKMKISGKQIDFRVSACPAYHGESIVLRILRPDSANMGLVALGFGEEDLAVFNKIIRRPNGIFLVTGPTGSGKTTTLYSALHELNRPDRKIITAEDPVEYNFTGINQCQVNEDIGLTFAAILRSMLRQAPNIILVGEIRDREVGDVAIQAALTGHLVFSTLHTNDAPSSITRLIDMGIKPFLVASSIQAVMAQRLIRVICQDCKTEDPEPEKRLLKVLGFQEAELAGVKIMKGAGCARCSGTGYRGRQGIFELMIMNNELRELAFNRASTGQIRKVARVSGMKPLLEDGKRKILAGTTTPEEICRVAQAEGIAAMHEEDEDVD